MRRPRHLSPDEKALWKTVAERATPMHELQVEKLIAPGVMKPVKRVEISAPLPHFRVGSAAKFSRPNNVLPPLAERLKVAPVNMDHKSFGKMKRGKLAPEARIDLHGMTIAEAHPELLAFILGSQAVGRRLVLVITGKGKGRDDGGPQGILRHQVPQWLALSPLAQAVLQVTPAHLRHGGHGAYYVYLKRQR